MLALSPSVPIYLHCEPIDMRKSFDGLYGIIKNDFQRDVRDGGLFMFLNQRRQTSLNRLVALKMIPVRHLRFRQKIECKKCWAKRFSVRW